MSRRVVRRAMLNLEYGVQKPTLPLTLYRDAVVATQIVESQYPFRLDLLIETDEKTPWVSTEVLVVPEEAVVHNTKAIASVMRGDSSWTVWVVDPEQQDTA